MPAIVEPVPDLDDLLLVAVAEAEPVVRARRGEQRDRDRGGEERDDEDVPLERRDLRPALRERHREEEREQHRDAREDDAQLVQQLDQLAVGALLRRLLLARARRPCRGTLLARADQS